MRNYFSIFLFFLIISGQNFVFAEISDPEGLKTEADQSYQNDEFMDAIEKYDLLFAEGYYSEEMLYRLAFMHENLKNYPEAIFYLQKSSQEFGSKDNDSKIKKIMREQGGFRSFSTDPWNNYFRFYRKVKWGMWALLLLGTASVVYALLVPIRQKPKWIKASVYTGSLLLFVAVLFMANHHFRTPDRAVIVQATSFYKSPSYAAERSLNGFSLGETVSITSHKDIWVEVEAGGRQWWVPKMVLREL